MNNYKIDLRKLSKETPLAVERGNWDGLRSDPLLLCTKEGNYHVGVMYEGVLDGCHFRDFFNEVSDYQILNVVYWAYLPTFPIVE